MRFAVASPDDRLVAQLQRPPELSDGVQSLSYWHERRRRLPWYRVRARREAALMVATWERRVGAALFVADPCPPGVRLSAGLLLGRTFFGRWVKRVALVSLALVAVMGAMTLAAGALLLHTLGL